MISCEVYLAGGRSGFSNYQESNPGSAPGDAEIRTCENGMKAGCGRPVRSEHLSHHRDARASVSFEYESFEPSVGYTQPNRDSSNLNNQGKSCPTIEPDASSRPGSSCSRPWRLGRTSRPRSRPTPRSPRPRCPPPLVGSRTRAPSTCTSPKNNSSRSSSPGRRTARSKTRVSCPSAANLSSSRSPSPRTRTAGGRRSKSRRGRET